MKIEPGRDFAFAIIHPDGDTLVDSIRMLMRDCKKEFTDKTDYPWKTWYKKGYRCKSVLVMRIG